MPYNVPINGHVSGLGKVRHREFAMASGGMSSDAFTTFLCDAFTNMASSSQDGAMHFIFIDWRHIRELSDAGAKSYTKLKALCVWNKTNAGMGSLYRSKHELVFVFKNGRGEHVNNVQLGRYGRYRRNVWDYAGANSFGATRQNDLESHSTVKPVGLIADAIRDCSKRGGLILAPFMGLGTTILAAERTSRCAAGIELDPVYVDCAIRHWQLATGGTATRVSDGQSFRDLDKTRKRIAKRRLMPSVECNYTGGVRSSLDSH